MGPVLTQRYSIEVVATLAIVERCVCHTSCSSPALRGRESPQSGGRSQSVSIRASISRSTTARRQLSGIGLDVRAGLHAGELEVRDDGDVSGLAVKLAARVEQSARDGELWASSTVRDMTLGSGVDFADEGERSLAFHLVRGLRDVR